MRRTGKCGWRPEPGPSTSGPRGYPSGLSKDVTLLDGRHALLRPIRPDDGLALRRAVAHSDPTTLRRRFLGGRPPRSDQEFERLVCVDYNRRMAVVALGPDGPGVGIAEVAVAVDPAWRHVGLATALVQLLAAAAVGNGLRHFTAEFFADNRDVTDIIAEAGAPYVVTDDSAGVIAAEIELPADPGLS
mgnify:CR=1 FL=1